MGNDQVVIITDATEGVGAATALAFARRGANLVLVASTNEKLENIAASLPITCQVLNVAIDVTATDAANKIVNAALARFGSIDVLINNIGLHHRGPVEEVTNQNLGQMIDVNLKVPIQFCGVLAKHFLKSGSGAIVNVGSLTGRTPLQGSATYAATKAGLRSFTYGLHDELRYSGIHIGIISPGPIDTGFLRSNLDDYENIVFSQKMSTVEQVAEAIVEVANGKKVEIVLPKSSALLTTICYLLPSMRRFLRPILYRKGSKIKEKYRKQQLTT